MSDSAVRLSGVTHRFGAEDVLRDVHLDIAHRQFVAIVGPSGCGKSTLLSIISGFAAPTTGIVQREGRLRTIYQQDGLFPWLTVGENVDLGLRGVSDTAVRAARREELLSLVGLSAFARHYPHQLSGGMRQLGELARALAGDTDILLMDEPFSALDYLVRLRMRHELARLLADYQRTVILVTHDIGEAAQLADRIIVLTERPGRVCCEVHVDLPRPRQATAPEVVAATQRILSEMGIDNDATELRRLREAPTD